MGHSNDLLPSTIPCDISELPRYLESLTPQELERFSSIYEVNEEFGGCIIPPAFVSSVIQWFAHDDELPEATLARVSNQSIIAIFNKLTCEEARCNPLRMKRPQIAKVDAAVAASTALENLYAKTEGRTTCDFCAHDERTSSDVWGRVHSPLGCVTASNIGKIAQYHGMTLLPYHHPVESIADCQKGASLMTDILATAQDWCNRCIEHSQLDVNSTATSSNVPHAKADSSSFTMGSANTTPSVSQTVGDWHSLLIWNAGMGSGASQPHGHVQLMVSKSHAPGRAEIIRRAAHQHHRTTGRDYLDDLLWCHQTVGLAIPTIESSLSSDTASAFVVVPLTPIASHELWAFGRTLADVAQALHIIVRVLREYFQVRCFNVGCLLPSLGHLDGSTKWITARVIDRTAQPLPNGNLYGAGFGAAELYGAAVEDTDLYETAKVIHRTAVEAALHRQNG